MTSEASLERARGRHADHRWAEAVGDFEAAGGVDALSPEDLERYAWSLTWTGPPASRCLDVFERVESAYRRAGDERGAARGALEQARMHALVGNDVVAASCWGRAVEALGDDHHCAEYGLAHVLAAYARLLDGALDDVVAPAEVAHRVGSRLGDPTVVAMADYVLGQQRLLNGPIDEGMDLLDHAMSTALHHDIHPMYTGIVYCGVLWACRLLGDWSRAAEWHAVAVRWSERENVCHFPAHLHVHRAELERIHGRFVEAERHARTALAKAGDWSRDLLAWAHYQLGETQLCRGDLAGAEGSFEHADRMGFAPEPGRSRLMLLQGRPEAAIRSISRAIDARDWYGLSGRAYTLPVGISTALALGRRELAAGWCDHLSVLAERHATPAASAGACVARGELALADGRPTEAVEHLSTGVEVLLRADAPYEGARARILLARAHAATGDRDQARRELATARTAFTELGAVGDRMHADRFASGMQELLGDPDTGGAMEDDDGLTPRQREVAALVARGYSNHRIAEELVVSRYTAETHVKHILSRLGFSSRTEIAAWAVERGLTPKT